MHRPLYVDVLLGYSYSCNKLPKIVYVKKSQIIILQLSEVQIESQRAKMKALAGSVAFLSGDTRVGSVLFPSPASRG